MKRLLLTMMALSIGMAVFAQESTSEKNSDGNEFLGKKIAVFTSGYQCDYDANKRTWNKMSAEADAMAQANAEMIYNMMKWYGGKALSIYDPNYTGLLPLIHMRNVDPESFDIEAKAKEYGVDPLLLKDYIGYAELQSLIQAMEGNTDFANLQSKAKKLALTILFWKI